MKTAELIVKNCKEKVPLGALLLAEEIIQPQDLDFALDHQKHSRQLLGEILVQMGALDASVLKAILKIQLSHLH